MSWQILQADVTNPLPLKDNSVQCVVTSPPYWGLRDYGTASWAGGDAGCDHLKRFQAELHVGSNGKLGKNNTNWDHRNEPYQQKCGRCGATRIDKQLGLEATPELYVGHMVAVFREIKRVLRDDGTVWVNLGDSYAGGQTAGSAAAFNGKQGSNRGSVGMIGKANIPPNLKPKDLVGIPWRVAFALQADGWYLRSAITWCKQNPMPVSVTDRPTKATEMIFLLAKSEHYYYDAEAVKEISVSDSARTTNGTALGGSTLTPKSDAALMADDSTAHLRGWCDFGQSQITIKATVTEQAKRLKVLKAICFTIIGEESERQFVIDLKPSSDATPLTAVLVALQRLASSSAPIRATIVNTATAPSGAVDTHSMNAVPLTDAGFIAETMLEPRLLMTSVTQESFPALVTLDAESFKPSLSIHGTFRPTHVLHDNRNTHNLRDWWVINTQPYPQAHFATFPEAIAERCIKAGTSEKGACSVCGAPWERVTERGNLILGDGHSRPNNRSKIDDADYSAYSRPDGLGKTNVPGAFFENKTTGWKPTCTHDALITPCIVLDPFSGAGTTALVADKLGRFGIGLELKKEYCDMAHRRCYDDAPLLAWAD